MRYVNIRRELMHAISPYDKHLQFKGDRSNKLTIKQDTIKRTNKIGVNSNK
jgi:hypothetical protein